MDEEEKLITALTDAARDFNDAVEALVKKTDLNVSVNSTTRVQQREIGRKYRSIEAVEYTITREIASYTPNR